MSLVHVSIGSTVDSVLERSRVQMPVGVQLITLAKMCDIIWIVTVYLFFDYQPLYLGNKIG